MFLQKIKIKIHLDKLSKAKNPVKLHIACGKNYKDGWINIDINPKVRKDFCIDVKKGLPFPDNSVDYIFNEHFIEHLSYDRGLFFLKEAHRILKPGGVIRTAFPDIDKIIDSYINDYWRNMEWVKLINAHWYPSGCYMLNKCIKENGAHQYMYSVKEIKRRLFEAGFLENNIGRCAVGKSQYSELINAERRADSGVVEAVKQ